jgi:hypothetical protein
MADRTAILGRLGLAALVAAASLTAQKGLAQQDWLYIGYDLPTEPDLAADARTEESKCLNARVVANAACRSGTGADCAQDVEIAFRRCVSGKPGGKFHLARCRLGNCEHVDEFAELSPQDAVDDSLIPGHIRSENTFVPLGLYADLGNGGCTIRRNSDNTAVDLPNLHSTGGMPVSVCKELRWWYIRRFKDAISRGDLGLVRESVDSGMFGEVGCRPESPREVLSYGGHIALMRGLRRRFGPTMFMTGDVCAALEEAAWCGQTGIVEFMLERGAAKYGIDYALIDAVASLPMPLDERFGGPHVSAVTARETARILLDHGAHPTPAVDVAVAREDLDMLKLLLSRGARLQENDWWDLLSAALLEGEGEGDYSRPCVEGLVNRDEHVIPMVSFLISQGPAAWRGNWVGPLCVAAARGEPRAFEMILTAGGQPMMRALFEGPGCRCRSSDEDNSDINPLSLVVVAGNSVETLEGFLKLPVPWSVGMRNRAVDEAGEQGNTSAAEVLIKHGANPNVGLEGSAYAGRVDAMEFFLRHGANVNTPTGSPDAHHPALFWAILGCSVDAVELALKHGAKLDFEGKHRGETVRQFLDRFLDDPPSRCAASDAQRIRELLATHNVH